MSQKILHENIIAMSEADSSRSALLEWRLYNIEMSEEPHTCQCGHYPIKELCHLSNAQTLNTTIVGNCCVQNFMGMSSKIIFDGAKRIAKDRSKAANEALIDFAYRKNWINDWERGFAHDTSRKRNLSDKQLGVRARINRKILRHMRSAA